MALASDGFNPVSGSGGVIAGALVLWWAGAVLAIPLTPGWIGLLVLHLAASGALVVAFSYLWGSLAFLAPRAAEEINSSTMRLLDQLRGFPLDGLGAPLATALLTMIPVGYVAWYPSRALLGLGGAGAVWLTPLAALLLGGVALLGFRRGLARYGRTGSSRYLSLGHRR